MERKGKLCGKDMACVAYYEFLGTAILAAGIVFLVGSGNPLAGVLHSGLAAILIPATLYVAITITGQITGGHHNPAVTLAILIGRGCWDKVHVAALCYWIPQFLGAMAGYVIAYITYKDTIKANTGNRGIGFSATTLVSGTDLSLGWTAAYQGWWVEMWCTYLFTYVVLVCSHPKTANSKDTQINMLTIVTGLAVAINFAAPRTGGAINPAIGFGLNTMSKIFFDYDSDGGIPGMAGFPAGSGNSYFANTWFIVVFPLLGGALAGVTYHFRHMPVLCSLGEGCEGCEEECGDDIEKKLDEVVDEVENKFEEKVTEMEDQSFHNMSREDDH